MYVDGSTFVFTTPAPSSPNPIVLGGNTVQTAANGGVVIGSSTYVQGAQATISGHAVSVGSGNVVVDGSTRALPTPSASSPMIVGGNAVQAAPNGGVAIGSSIISAGSQTTISGHAISVGSNNIVIDGTTQALAIPATASAILIIGSSLQRASNGGLIVGTSTLTPSAQTTVAGHALSIDSSNVILDGTTYALPTSAGAVLMPPSVPQKNTNMATLSNGAVMTAGGSVAALPGGQVITAGGSAATVSGTVISLGTSAVQVGSSMIAIPKAGAASSSPGALGGVILSAFNAQATGTSGDAGAGVSTRSGGAGASSGMVSTTAGSKGQGSRTKRRGGVLGLGLGLCFSVGARLVAFV